MESYINMLLINYLKVLKKFVVFSGRAERREFWMYILLNLIVYIILGILGSIPFIGKLFSLVSALYFIGILVPTLAVGSRRLHDADKTGFLLFLLLIPIAGVVAVLVLCASDGSPGNNQYGPNPKNES